MRWMQYCAILAIVTAVLRGGAGRRREDQHPGRVGGTRGRVGGGAGQGRRL